MNFKALRLLAAGMIVAASTVAMTGTAMAADASEGDSILVVTDTAFPPFESMKDGKIVGFDIDMIKMIAQQEGLTITLKPMPFDGIIPSLQSGAADVAVSGMFITKARAKNINFSDAYFHSGVSVLVRKGSPIKGFDDLLDGHVVAAKKGTSGAAYLRNHGVPMQAIKQFQNNGAMYQSLLSGSVDAVVYENVTNVMFIEAGHPDVKVVGGILGGAYYGIGVTKGKPELLKKINAGLAKIRANGDYKKLFQKWFNGDMSSAVMEVEKPTDVAVDR